MDIQVDSGLWSKFWHKFRENWLHTFPIDFPDLTVKSFEVVVVELFMLQHPVPELLILKSTLPNVDVIAFENTDGKLFD